MNGIAVLAYSGGLDTSCAIAWLKEDYGFEEVVAVLVDVGQEASFHPAVERGKLAGADDVLLLDRKEAFADTCMAALAEYAPNLPRAVIDRQVLSPLDLERRFALTGGNIFQGAMTLNQLFSLRPLPRYADYRTPIRGLYLCGAATHPGGGVMGACGYNAAREIVRDARKPRV